MKTYGIPKAVPPRRPAGEKFLLAMRMDHNSSIQVMAQHFLLSTVARALRSDDMHFISDRNNEGLAYLLFMLFRWGSLTTQICPKCGVIDQHQPRVAHKQWRCKHCRHDFSLKSGSLFEGTKLPYSTLLKAMYVWSDTSKGISAVAMTRALNIGYHPARIDHSPCRFCVVPVFWIKPLRLWRASAIATLEEKSFCCLRVEKVSSLLRTM